MLRPEMFAAAAFTVLIMASVVVKQLLRHQAGSVDRDNGPFESHPDATDSRPKVAADSSQLDASIKRAAAVLLELVRLRIALSWSEIEAPSSVQRKPAQRQQSRLDKEREKSRKAQKRYRERQKSKLEEYKASVDALTSQVTSLLQDKQSLESRNCLLEKVVHMQQTRAVQPQQTVQASGNKSAAVPVDPTALAKHDDFFNLLYPDRKITVEELTSWTVRDHIAVYEDFIEQMSIYFKTGTHDPYSTRRVTRMAQLLRDLTKVFPPEATMECTAIMKSEARMRHGPPDPAIWPMMLAALQLSPAQRARALEARCTLLTTIGRIIEERRKIIASLQAAMPTTDPDDQDAVRFLTATRAAEQLRGGLEEERACIINFMHGMTHEVLTPLQEARCLVEARPWLPDMLALTKELAAAAGLGSAEALPTVDYLTNDMFEYKTEPGLAALLAPNTTTLPGSDLRFLEAFIGGSSGVVPAYSGYSGMFTFSNRF
ncbi:hypothetical protein WJX72_008219 [[Myrmecia] bisecta]|uniref:BZIP domain-containing protein n=1 Tax=[Myrmecia] bisecta TaxID=41462 RepID=A0AAW1PXQ5_9CHLO